MENFPVDAPNGNSGRVVDRELYSKEEWFIKDVVNGCDLGKFFCEAFQDIGFHLKNFLIANDTPLTMTSAEACDGGMVASTGLNATLVKPVDHFEDFHHYGSE